MLSINRFCICLTLVSLQLNSALAAPALSRTQFTAIDIETTGFSPSNDRIVELSAIRFVGTNILSTKSWLVDPEKPIPRAASRVHGITDSMVKGKPKFQEIADEVSMALSNSIVVAHNAGFDWRFIKSEYKRADKRTPDVNVLDTLKLTRKAFPTLRSHALKALTEQLNIDAAPTHRAEADALVLPCLTDRCFNALGTKINARTLAEFFTAGKTVQSPHEKALKETPE